MSLKSKLKQFEDKKRIISEMYIGQGMSPAQIAKARGVSRWAVTRFINTYIRGKNAKNN